MTPSDGGVGTPLLLAALGLTLFFGHVLPQWFTRLGAVGICGAIGAFLGGLADLFWESRHPRLNWRDVGGLVGATAGVIVYLAVSAWL